jgi:hypothetical protein
MKKSLLLIIILTFTVSLQAQKDTIGIAKTLVHQDISRNYDNINVTIYPVPVRNNTFTIKTDREVSFIRITNIIGQDILKVQYNNPEPLIKISLDNPKRGMYLVTILFKDGARIVKKIMVEETD